MIVGELIRAAVLISLCLVSILRPWSGTFCRARSELIWSSTPQMLSPRIADGRSGPSLSLPHWVSSKAEADLPRYPCPPQRMPWTDHSGQGTASVFCARQLEATAACHALRAYASACSHRAQGESARRREARLWSTAPAGGVAQGHLPLLAQALMQVQVLALVLVHLWESPR